MSGNSRSLDLAAVKGDTSGGDKVRRYGVAEKLNARWLTAARQGRPAAVSIPNCEVESDKGAFPCPRSAGVMQLLRRGDATSDRVTAGPWESTRGTGVADDTPGSERERFYII